MVHGFRHIGQRGGALAGVVLIVLVGGRSTVVQAEDKDSLADRAKRMLAQRCVSCHNAGDLEGGLDLTRRESALKGGENGRVIRPGDPSASAAWKRVSAAEMPPDDPLAAEEIELLRRWIDAGVPWNGGPIDPRAMTTKNRAGYDWWSLQPIERPEPPAVRDDALVANPIDRFIVHKLDEHGLSLSPPAQKRVLVRRLSFDLLGLPPCPEDVDAFLADESPYAYEKLVDRFLESPHYGERWARHWLDVIRFGESQGFERDKLRPNAWPYRDWVIQSFNDDLPYDAFIRQQLAGDVVRRNDPLAVAATGFLVAGPWDEVGQKQQSAAMKAVVRQDELEDIVSLVGQTFLGLTINCARCHDHKFDPVSQTDYYRVVSALSGIRHGERAWDGDSDHPNIVQNLSGLKSEIEQLEEKLAAIDQPIRKAILAERSSEKGSTVSVPEPIAEWDFGAGLKDGVGSMDGKLKGNARLEDGKLALDGRNSYLATAPLSKTLTTKTLDVRVTLNDLAQRGGGVMSLQTLNGKVFDAIVFAEQESNRWLAGSDRFTRTQSFGGASESEADKRTVDLAVAYAADGTITAYRNGMPYGAPYQAATVATFEAGKAQVLFGLRHAPAGGNKLLAGAIERARLYDRALSPDEIAASAGTTNRAVSEDAVLARLSVDARANRNRLVREISQRRTRLRLLQGRTVYAVLPKEPKATHVLKRGDTRQPGEVVKPGGVAAVCSEAADFMLAADAAEAPRRRRLAEWITHPENPLTARVIANRLWHYHFGAGIVDTPNDLGFNGGRPTHPELLDWLASELIRQHWSLKSLHETIVMSATYRQSSRWNAAAARLDAGSRLLWRKPPQRLDAESVRDAILVVSGALNPRMGGPGYRDFRTFTNNTQFYFPIDPVGFALQRRSIYRTWARTGTNRFLDVFDCPDPSTKTPCRAVTTTPMQALALLNTGFILRLTHQFANRQRQEFGPGVEAQIKGAYQLAYARSPDDEEIETAKRFTAVHGLPAFCRVIFNSNEFLYVD